MSFEITHDRKTGVLRLSYKRHVLVALGLLLLAAGVAALNAPWWQPIVEGILGRAGIAPNPTYQSLVGLSLVATGSALLWYKHFVLDRYHARLKADKLTLQRFELHLDEMREYLRQVVDYHSFKSKDHSSFHELHTRFTQPEHSFQDSETSRCYRELSSAGGALETFMAVNFWIFPNDRLSDGNYQYCLAPHMNIDRGLIVYDAEKVREYQNLANQLADLVRRAETSLESFVAIIKAKGHLQR